MEQTTVATLVPGEVVMNGVKEMTPPWLVISTNGSYVLLLSSTEFWQGPWYRECPCRVYAR